MSEIRERPDGMGFECVTCANSKDPEKLRAALSQAEARITALQAREKALREALRPFARFADVLEVGNNLNMKRSEMPNDHEVYGFNNEAITMGDFRRARTVSEEE